MSEFAETIAEVPQHANLRPKEGYQRIDETVLSGEFSSIVDNHAIHDTLSGPDRVEVYEIFKHDTEHTIFSIIKFGNSLNGHPGVVHGGITGLLFDNTFGWLFYSLKIAKSVTANLNLNYRKPILAGSTVILRTSLEKQEGRKLFMKATMEDPESGTILADASTLFITLKKEE